MKQKNDRSMKNETEKRKENEMKKRLFAGLLALAMTVNLMSATAFAEETKVLCDKTVECAAEEHDAECEFAKAEATRLAEEAAKAAEEAKAAKCANLEGCAEDAHNVECPLYVEVKEPVKEETQDPVQEETTEPEQTKIKSVRLGAMPVAEITGLSGSGTENDPYLINNLAELKWFRDDVNKLNNYAGKYVKLTADIDLSKDVDSDGEVVSWVPIGNMNVDKSTFKGVFDGGNHTISNLYIYDKSSGLAFFGRTGSFIESDSAVIKNIIFNNVDVTAEETYHWSSGHGDYVGGVIANSSANTTVSNVKLTGDIYVTGCGYVGGIIGHGYPEIENCSVDGEDGSYIHGGYWCAGGILGYGGEGNGATTIKNCSVADIDIWSGYGGAAAVCGYTQSGAAGETLKITNVKVTSGSDYMMGYVFGNGKRGTLKDVTVSKLSVTANGKEITSTDAIAISGDKLYFSLADAIAQGGKITLLKDIESSEIIVIDKAITLDGNGYKLTSTAGRAINVNCAGDVTIEDLTIATASNTERAINIIEKAANLTLENVVAEGFKYTINVAASSAGSNIKINGGKYSGYAALNVTGNNTTITAKNVEFIGINDAALGESNDYAVISVGDYTTSGSTDNVTISITGGKLTAISEKGNRQFALSIADAKNPTVIIDAELGLLNNDVLNLLMKKDYNGASTVVENPSIKVREEYANELIGQEYCVEAATNGFVYADTTLADTLERSKDGDTVKLLGNVSSSEIIVIDKAITLDGNGYKLTSTAKRAVNVDCAGNVTIKDLTIATTNNTERAINVIQKAANLTLDNVAAEGFKYTINVAGSSAGSNIIINGGKYSGYAAMNVTGNNTTITAKNVEFIGINDAALGESNDYAVISVGDYTTSGSTDNVTISITGGKLTAISEKGNRQFALLIADAKNPTVIIDAELGLLNNDVLNLLMKKDYKGASTVVENPSVKVREEYADEVVALGYAHKAALNGLIEVNAPCSGTNGHEFTDKVVTEPTCTATGVKHNVCKHCGTIKSVGTVAATGHSYSGYKSDADNHWKECSCGSRTATGAHKYKVGGVCTTCSYKKTVEEDKTETKPSSSSSSSTTTTTTPETTTQTTTTQTTTTTKTETTTTPSEEAAIPVEEVKVDTKIVEEKATEEVKAAVKETVTVAEVKEVEKTTEDGTVTVTEVKVAVTTETIDKVIENTEAGATVILPLTEAAEEGQAVTEAEVAVEALEKIAEAESALTVEFEGVKVTFEAETIKAIAEQAQGSVIELRVVPVEHHELNEDQQAVLEAHDVAVRVSAQIFSDGEYIGDFKGGKATIAIPFTPAEGRAAEDHKVYFVADNGEMTLMPAVYVDGHMVFETTHFSDYVIVYDEVASAEEGPADIEEDMAVEEAPVEVEKEAGLPIIPIVIIVVVIIAVVAFLATRKKYDEE